MTVNPGYGQGVWYEGQWRPIHYAPPVEHHYFHRDPLTELKELLMTVQADLATQTSAIAAQTAILTDIKTAVDALKASNPSIDTSGLDAAVAGEGAAVTALQVDVATTPAPDPVPVPVDQPPVVDPNTTDPATNSNPTPADPTASV